jgi:hypothetical protein
MLDITTRQSTNPIYTNTSLLILTK